MSETLFETERLRVREMDASDADFYLAVLSDPDFRLYIADRGVRTEEQALAQLSDRVFTSYEVYGFGMWLVSRKDSGEPVGMVGLVKRDFLENVDLGYAFLPTGRGAGFATEAARGAMDYALRRFNISRLSAIVSGENRASIGVLERLGFDHRGQVVFPDDGDTCEHFICELEAVPVSSRQFP